MQQLNFYQIPFYLKAKYSPPCSSKLQRLKVCVVLTLFLKAIRPLRHRWREGQWNFPSCVSVYHWRKLSSCYAESLNNSEFCYGSELGLLWIVQSKGYSNNQFNGLVVPSSFIMVFKTYTHPFLFLKMSTLITACRLTLLWVSDSKKHVDPLNGTSKQWKNKLCTRVFFQMEKKGFLLPLQIFPLGT